MAYIENEDAYNKAISRRIKANSWKTNKDWINLGDNAAIISFLENNSKNSFYGKLLTHYQDYGKLSEGQVACVRKGIEKKATQLAERAANSVSKHVGIVGSRQEFSLTIVHIAEFQTNFSYYGETGYIYICTDANGNMVVYKGSKQFMFQEVRSTERMEPLWTENPNAEEVAQGKRFVFTETKQTVNVNYEFPVVKGDLLQGKATVKAHEMRDGIAQTVVTRPAFIVTREI